MNSLKPKNGRDWRTKLLQYVPSTVQSSVTWNENWIIYLRCCEIRGTENWHNCLHINLYLTQYICYREYNGIYSNMKFWYHMNSYLIPDTIKKGPRMEKVVNARCIFVSYAIRLNAPLFQHKRNNWFSHQIGKWWRCIKRVALCNVCHGLGISTIWVLISGINYLIGSDKRRLPFISTWTIKGMTHFIGDCRSGCEHIPGIYVTFYSYSCIFHWLIIQLKCN